MNRFVVLIVNFFTVLCCEGQVAQWLPDSVCGLLWGGGSFS